MTNKAKEIVLKYMMENDKNVAIKRIAALVSEDVINLLTEDKMAVEMTEYPNITDIREFRSLANDCGCELTSNGCKCAEASGTLKNAVKMQLDITQQQVCARYEYSWEEDGQQKKDYDHLYIPVDRLYGVNGFRFETI